MSATRREEDVRKSWAARISLSLSLVVRVAVAGREVTFATTTASRGGRAPHHGAERTSVVESQEAPR